MDTANDGSLNRHGGQADMESNADERARERAEAVEDMAHHILNGTGWVCPECDADIIAILDETVATHLATCELLRARAENEVDAAERGR